MNKKVGAIIIIQDGNGVEVDRTNVMFDEDKIEANKEISMWIGFWMGKL